MVWWQWCVLGALFLGAEIAVDAEFYLVFLGISALVVGLIGTTPIALPMWGQWLAFSLIAVSALVLFRSRAYNKIRGETPDLEEGVAGETAVVDEPIAPGAMGRATLRGSPEAPGPGCSPGDGPASPRCRIRRNARRPGGLLP